MKFTNVMLLALATLASAKPQATADELKSEIVNVGNTNPEDLAKSASPACKAEYEALNKCQFKSDGNTQGVSKNECDNFYNSEECNDFAKMVIKGKTECEGALANIQITYDMFNMICAKDDENNYCPMSAYMQEFDSQTSAATMKPDTFTNIAKDSCKSERCIAAARKGASMISSIGSAGGISLKSFENSITNELDNCKPEQLITAKSESGAMSNISKVGLTTLIGSVLALLF